MITASLDWYPKEFRAGDADGKINESLMGKPELSPLEILIRETAQNSWDARIPGKNPYFSVSLRKINPREIGYPTLLPMSSLDYEFIETLSGEEMHLIEIADRNTTGLDGPVDMGPVAEGEVSKNFEDLIYKVGVPRQDGKGGGTYGFGKTATYGYSHIGTVVFWTRCLNEIGNLEHRFIVSCFRPQYIEGDKQYTGRHWWGKKDLEVDHILPVQGEEAQHLGELLFERHFEAEETGTSLLILAPKLEMLSDSFGSEDLSSQPFESTNFAFKTLAKEAIREHLWPKLVPLPGEENPPINMRLYVDGEDIPLVEEEDFYLNLWGKTLNYIRESAKHLGMPPRVDTSLISTQVLEVKYRHSVIGHLAISQFVRAEDSSSTEVLNPARGERNRTRHIALMREQAELIVTSVDWFAMPDEEDMDWVAVFRSTAEFDPLYAESEPPAHDAWNSKTERKDVQLLVRHTTKRVTELLSSVLQPVIEQGGDSGSNITRTAKVATRLSSLLPVAPITENEEVTGKSRKNRRPQGSPSEKPVTLHIRQQSYLGFFEEKQTQRIHFGLTGDAQFARVTLDVTIVGEDSATEHIPSEELGIIWENFIQIENYNVAVFKNSLDGSVVFKAPPRVALRISLTAEEAI